MKTLLLTLHLFLAPADSVYLCNGGMSHVYHRQMFCKGLDHCSTHLQKATEEDAKAIFKRRPCGYCYPKKKKVQK